MRISREFKRTPGQYQSDGVTIELGPEDIGISEVNADNYRKVAEQLLYETYVLGLKNLNKMGHMTPQEALEKIEAYGRHPPRQAAKDE